MESVRERVPGHTVAANLRALALGQEAFSASGLKRLFNILLLKEERKVALIKSFRALRPVPESGPPGGCSSLRCGECGEEARVLVRDNPFSFLHVRQSRRSTWILLWTLTTGQVYARGRWQFTAGWCRKVCSGRMRKIVFTSTGWIKDGGAQTGLVACCSIDDYLQGTIKKHEHTRADKETGPFSDMWMPAMPRLVPFF
ncbi:MAG: DUF1015 family protein [Bacillota bacterium]